MDRFKQKRFKKTIRHTRVRARVSGDANRPRLAVFRSDKHIYAQIIDDVDGKTLVSASDMDIKSGKKAEKAAEVGQRVAQLAKKRGITAVRFDRGGFKYHGRVKALDEGAREGGLQF